jgi:hypothetical protein
MKLVMTYTIYSCPDSWDIIQPVEYESVDKAEYDFLELCEKNMKENNRIGFNFGGKIYDWRDFYQTHEYGKDKGKRVYDAPKFYTLENWWEQNL